MTVRISRLTPGQTRYYIAQNIDSRIDRQALGFWYVNLHIAPFFVEFYGKAVR